MTLTTTSTDSTPPAVRDLPDTPFYRAMRQGHCGRFGHPLSARLVTEPGSAFATLQRLCCTNDTNDTNTTGATK